MRDSKFGLYYNSNRYNLPSEATVFNVQTYNVPDPGIGFRLFMEVSASVVMK